MPAPNTFGKWIIIITNGCRAGRHVKDECDYNIEMNYALRDAFSRVADSILMLNFHSLDIFIKLCTFLNVFFSSTFQLAAG